MKKGFTLVEIMIVVAIIGLLAAIAIPAFMKSRQTAQKNVCINNMRLIDSAKEQFAVEEGLTNGATVALADIGPSTNVGGGYLREWLVCPAGGDAKTKERNSAMMGSNYTIGVVGAAPECRMDPDNHIFVLSTTITN